MLEFRSSILQGIASMANSAIPTPHKDLIDINQLKSPLVRAALRLFDGTLHYSDFNKRYAEAMASDDANYFDLCLNALNVGIDITEEDFDRIPRSGPVVIVANHPFGGLDGVVMGSLLTKARSDSKLLVNYLLAHMEKIRPHIISVDPFGNKNSAQANLRPMRESIKWLKEGHVLGTFPSGTVSHIHFLRGSVTDPVWNPNIASIIKRTNAQVLPMFFHGRNSGLFQAAGLVHPLLRTALLPREVISKKDTTIRVSVGKPIAASRLDKFSNAEEVMEHLRLKTYVLRGRHPEPQKRKLITVPKLPKRKVKDASFKDLIDPVDPSLMVKEIEALSEEHHMVSHGSYSVYLAKKSEFPNVLTEIGRLRERTFREVGEGTGESFDLDEFDEYYSHLIMWNHKKEEIVGGYRVGQTDLILNEQGVKGLYTSTLFKYKSKLLDKLTPGIELGRSFIVSEYQRKHTSLSLIWRGIGEYCARNPQYNILFGPCSISHEYHRLSRDLIIQFLKTKTMDDSFKGQVKAKRPPKTQQLKRQEKKYLESGVQDIEDISMMVSEIETDQKGVPVLLRQYLKLNGKLLSFNVDKDFANVIDGLVLVDMLKSDEKMMRRVMTNEGFENMKKFHNQQ